MQQTFTKSIRSGVAQVCRELEYAPNHINMVLNGKRQSLPVLLALKKYFPALLKTATFDVAAEIKKHEHEYDFIQGDWKYGIFKRKSKYDRRFIENKNKQEII